MARQESRFTGVRNLAMELGGTTPPGHHSSLAPIHSSTNECQRRHRDREFTGGEWTSSRDLVVEALRRWETQGALLTLLMSDNRYYVKYNGGIAALITRMDPPISRSPYILYRPVSSSLSPSSHLRSSSLVTRSETLVACLEFFKTSSST